MAALVFMENSVVTITVSYNGKNLLTIDEF